MVCCLETSWNRCRSPPPPAGRFPFPYRTGNRPRLPCTPLCAPYAMPWGSSKSASTPWKPGSSSIPRPPTGHRRQTRPPRSRASAHPLPHPQKAGGKLGHLGHRQALFPPTTLQELRPARCACGNTTFALTTPYHTPQVLELPPSALAVTHGVLHQGWCPDGGRWSKAPVPAEHATGDGPRLRALMGARAGA
jgi:hypothetical protein